MRRLVALLAGAMLASACTPRETELGVQQPPSDQTPIEQNADGGTPPDEAPHTPEVATGCAWEQSSMPTSVVVSGLYADESVQLVRLFSGEHFRSTDGHTWMPLYSVDTLPYVDAGIVRVGTVLYGSARDQGVVVSEDNGLSWSTVNDGLDMASVHAIVDITTDGTAPYVLGMDGYLSRFDASARSWSTVATPTTFMRIWMGNGLWLAQRDDGGTPLRSTDGGRTWKPTETASTFPTLGAGVVRHGQVLLGKRGTSATSGTVVLSDDEGLSWTPLDLPAGATGIPQGLTEHRGAALASWGADTYVLGADERWTLLASLPRRSASEIRTLTSDGRQLFATTASDGIHRMLPQSTTWEPAGQLPGGRAYAVAWGAGAMFASSRSGEVFRSTDDGLTWASSAEGFEGLASAFAAVGNTVYAGTMSSGMFRSEDKGLTWEPINDGFPRLDAINNDVPRMVSAIAATSQVIVVGTPLQNEAGGGQSHSFNSGGLWRSTNGGVSWEQANNGIPTDYDNYPGDTVRFEVPTDALVAVDEDTFLASLGSLGLWRSENGGASWVPSNVGVPRDTSGIYARIDGLVRVGDSLFAGGYDTSPTEVGFQVVLLRSEDEGRSWTPAATGLPARALTGLTAVGDALFASVGFRDAPSEEDGVYVSLDKGESWQQVSQQPAPVVLGQVAGTSQALFATSETAGLQRLAFGVCQ